MDQYELNDQKSDEKDEDEDHIYEHPLAARHGNQFQDPANGRGVGTLGEEDDSPTCMVLFRVLLDPDIPEYIPHDAVVNVRVWTAAAQYKDYYRLLSLDRNCKVEGGYWLLEGKVQVETRVIERGMWYKYYTADHPEYIYCKNDSKYHYVDRWFQLKRPSKVIKIFDAITRCEAPTVLGFRKDTRVEDAERAIRAFLPKWNGFFGSGIDMNASTAIADLQEVILSLSEIRLRKGYANGRVKEHKRKKLKKLSIPKVLSKFLHGKLCEYKNDKDKRILQIPKNDVQKHIDRIVSALAIAIVMKRIPLAKDQICGLAVATFVNCKDAIMCKMIIEKVCKNFHNKCELIECIQAICSTMIKHKEVYWLYCLPILHILTSQCEPQVIGSLEIDKITSNEWWGMKSIDASAFVVKDSSNIQDILEILSPYFFIHTKLPRALIYLVDPFDEMMIEFSKSWNIPTYIIYARLYQECEKRGKAASQKHRRSTAKLIGDPIKRLLQVFIDKNNDAKKGYEDRHRRFPSVIETIRSLRTISPRIPYPADELALRKGIYNIAVALLKSVCSCELDVDVIQLLAKFFVSEVNLTRQIEDTKLPSNDEDGISVSYMEHDIAYVAIILWNVLNNNVKRKFPINETRHLKSALLAWTYFIEMPYVNETLRTRWIEQVSTFIRSALLENNMRARDRLYVYLNSDFVEVSQHIHVTIKDAIFNDLKEAENHQHIKDEILNIGQGGKRYGAVVAQLVDRTWPNVCDEQLLKHLLHEKLWQLYMTLWDKTELEDITLLHKVTAIIQGVSENMVNGDVKLGTLKTVIEKKDEFLQLFASISECPTSPKSPKKKKVPTATLR